MAGEILIAVCRTGRVAWELIDGAEKICPYREAIKGNVDIEVDSGVRLCHRVVHLAR